MMATGRTLLGGFAELQSLNVLLQVILRSSTSVSSRSF